MNAEEAQSPTRETAKPEEKPRAAAKESRPQEGAEESREDAERRRARRRQETYGEAVICRPLEVVVKDDRVEQAIRQLKNRLAREGVLRELKNRRHYFKPSELKRIKRREAARRRRKQARQRANRR